MKRIARDVFGFSDEQLYGPSEMRNAPDERYPREHEWKPDLETNRWSLFVLRLLCRSPRF